MGEEALETFVVMTSQIINAISSEAGSYTSKFVFVNERKVGTGIIDGTKIVVHALTSPVTADFFVPCRAVTRQSVAVRCHDDISVGCHYLEVPAETPKLANRILRSTFAI